MKKFLNEFRIFISKGNVLDLAIGVIVGGMFTQIVNSLTNDILMPIISLITNRTSFENMFVALNGGDYKTLAEAAEVGAPVIAYGNLIQLILNFFITAFCLFLIVKGINRLNDMNDHLKIKDKKDIEEEKDEEKTEEDKEEEKDEE